MAVTMSMPMIALVLVVTVGMAVAMMPFRFSIVRLILILAVFRPVRTMLPVFVMRLHFRPVRMMLLDPVTTVVEPPVTVVPTVIVVVIAHPERLVPHVGVLIQPADETLMS